MSHRNMKEELTCPICMELFRQPRRLPCGHSYCYVCLKAMLDRCTERSGLYLDYSRSLVCPECREEVSIESDRGVEMIPPDFKLSKLVDLFKFMKTNDSSDSSCDEQQSCKPVSPADSASTAPVAAAQGISLPATSPSTGSSSSQTSHVFTSTSDQSTQPLHLSAPSASTSAVSAHSRVQSHVSAHSQLQSPSTHRIVESSSAIAASATTVPSPSIDSHPNVEFNNSQATSGDSPADTHHSEIRDLNTFDVDREASLNNLSPATVICNVVTTLPGSSQSPSSAAENQPQLDLVGGSSERSQAVSHSSLIVHGRDPSEDFSSVSELGIDAVVEVAGDNGFLVIPEQQVDLLEIVSNWVNENNYYSQGSRNLSHSAVSLPAEVVLEQVESCQETLPGLTCNVDRGARAQSVPTETGDWNQSAQPGGSGQREASKNLHHVKVRKVKRGVFSRFVDSDSSSDSSSNNGRENHRSAGKPKRWLMTRFLRSVILSDSSSTGYSDDDDDVDRNATSSTTERKTIHSQQNHVSASQQSQPQTDAAAEGSCPEVDHQRLPESNQGTGSNTHRKVSLGCMSAGGIQSQATSQQHNFSTPDTSRNTGSNMPGAGPGSVDSNTSAKRQVRDTEAALSSADTLPKVTHGGKSTGESQNVAHAPFSASESYGRDSHLSERRSQSFDMATQVPQRVISSPRRKPGHPSRRTHLPSAGSPPTFYDNFSPLSDGGEGRTLYDNVARGRTPHAAEGPGLVRDLSLNPCNQQQSFESPSQHGHGRTFYDNIDGHHAAPNHRRHHNTPDHISATPNHRRHHNTPDHISATPNHRRHHNRPDHISATPNHRRHHNRNSLTEIDDLKTGYEHFPMENLNSIETDTKQLDARLPLEPSHRQHMGELDHCHRSLSFSSPSEQHAAEHSTQAGYNIKCSSSSRAQKQPVHTGQVLDSGDHHSFYDNINNPHSLGQPQAAVAASKRGNHSDGASLTEGQSGRLARKEGNTGACHQISVHTQGRNGDDELHYMDNYLDHYSEQSRNASSARKAASSGMIVGRRTSQTSGVGDRAKASAGTASLSTAGCGSQAAGGTSSEGRNPEGGSVEHGDAGTEVVDSENGSNSGTSMLQNKKKPRSRLKKFLTSLLSLSSSSSSSSDDEIHGEVSSESSGW